MNLGVIWDDKSFGPEAVHILFDMISRNLPEGTEGKFVCFTDWDQELGPWIEKRPLNASRDGVYMLPLNCLVIRGLDALLKHEQVKSCFYEGTFPEDAAVVVFPEGVKPQDCDNWVRHVYKIGGGSSAEMTFVPSVSKEVLKENIRYSFRKAKQWFEPEIPHDKTAIIIGGGPSLEDEIPFLKVLAPDCTVFALNAVPGYLRRLGIGTDVHVMLDAHAGCEAFVWPGSPTKRYYASQCDKGVLFAASQLGDSLVCWHAGGEPMDELAKEGYSFLNIVGGGSTGATRAMVLAYGLGYRKMHLFGMDSSYDGDRGHAYDQADYEKFLSVTCGDEVFKTSPQLLGQAEDFKLIAPGLVAAACEITVHGKGLLRAVADQMAA